MNPAAAVVLSPRRHAKGRDMMNEVIRAEGQQEANYIVYILDGVGRISGAEWIAARDDEDAMAQARRLARSGRCELWQRTRRIARLG
jgi:hypothetical protein